MKHFLQSSKNCLSILLIAMLGIVLCQANRFVELEEDWGLGTLFLLRGPLATPPDVVIIMADKISEEILHLDEDPEKWPRSYYAQLIDKLNAYQPALIAFNIHFAEQRTPEDDAILAQAIAAKKNVVLTSYIKQFPVRSAPMLSELSYERIIQPVPELESTAIATAPFPIPKSLSTVKQFWTYKDSIGDIPTLPMAIFQCYLLKENYIDLLAILQKIDAPLYAKLPKSFDQLSQNTKPLELFQEIQTALIKHHFFPTQIAHQLQATAVDSLKEIHLLQSWQTLINSDHRLYLNYYGDVGAITTLSLHQALALGASDVELLRHKIILVGYSTDIEPERNQGFYTAFSKNGESNVSSVEIAATAIANLMDASWIKPLPKYYQFLLVVVWGSLIFGIFRIYSYKTSLGLIALLNAIYLTITYIIFIQYEVWVPLFAVTLQTSYITLFESILHLRKIYKVSARYLPQNVFTQNAQHPDAMDSYGQLMQGVCMATDAGQYTTLSESMNPVALNVLMNKYYGTMFPAVKAHHGLISDVIGDAMLAIWAKPVADQELRSNACHAALKIYDAIQHFNQSPSYQLPTRLGLHYGEMRLGNVGAIDHYEYRAVGDIVNTSTRIEGLNKIVGTRILVSNTVIEGLSDFTSREIGLFMLKGKTQPITIFELIGKNSQTDPKLAPLLHSFGKALQLFQGYQWSKAQKAFLNINKYYPNDGPTLFYVYYLQKYLGQQDEQSRFLPKPVIDVTTISETWRYLDMKSK